MRIEVLEKFKHSGQTYELGEVRVVGPALGIQACANGWAKDLDGNVETGELKRGDNASLNPENISHDQIVQ